MHIRQKVKHEASDEASCSQLGIKTLQNDDEDILFATGYLILKRTIQREKEEEARKGRKICVREIYKQKNESRIYHNLVLEMALGDRELYFK